MRLAKHEAARRRLQYEYLEKLQSRDPEVLETSRDWADNDAAPWRMEVFMALAMVVLFVGVPILIGFFMVIEAMTGK